MSAASEQDIENWKRGVDSLRAYIATDSHDEQTARDAVYRLWSSNGFHDAPDDIQQMFIQLVEMGYIAALRGFK